MATNRRKIMRKRREMEVSEPLQQYFLTGRYPHEDQKTRWMILTPNRLKAVWEMNRDLLIAKWIEENPCTRPWYWWGHDDAPLEPVKSRFDEISYHARRERIGGTGTPAPEVLNIGPSFINGIPDWWVSKFDEEYYNGRALDVDGNLIETNYQEGDFKGVAPDPDDPPTFESQAAYLDRHGLLTAAEKRHLAKHPELLEPEALEFEEDDLEDDEPAT